MGAQLVTQAFARYSHVSDRAFRILLRMAVTALDNPKDDQPAKVYFAGRELLAMSLRTDGGTADSRYRAVARAIAELVKEGAIERIGNGRTGHNAEFRLTLGRPNQGGQSDHPARTTKRDSQGGQSDHPQGGSFDHPQGGQFDPDRVAKSTTPRNQEEPLEELKEEEGVEVITTSHPPRVAEAVDAKIISFPASSPTTPARNPRPSRAREQGRAELAAKAEAVRAAMQARLTRQETS